MTTHSAEAQTSSLPIVNFYDPSVRGVDFRGRSLNDILVYSDIKLEQSHNYIQVLFPLPEGSPFNLSAPVIDKATFDTFRQRPDLRASVREAFSRMLSFYGFDLCNVSVASPRSDKGITNVVPNNNAEFRFRNWVVRFNHNHLRITRIIRSLRVLGLEDEAIAFFDALKKLNRTRPGRIGSTPMMYWTRAAKRPLNIAPDEDDEGDEESEDGAIAIGPAFLREFEKSGNQANQA